MSITVDNLPTELLELLTEKARRQKQQLKYVPTDLPHHNQKAIHESTKPILLIFGGNQSGKSMSSTAECVWRLRGKHPFKETTPPPITVWCISTEYATIQNGAYRHYVDLTPDWDVEQYGPKIQGHDMHSYIRYKNGSIVRFYSAKGREEARQKLQAAKVDVLQLDEEISSDVYDELLARQLAARSPVIIISATLINSEPWIIKLEERAEAGDQDITLTRLDTEHSPYVDKSVFDRLTADWDEETKEYRIHGRSRRYAGLVYKGYSDALVIDPFLIPEYFTVYHSLDPGIRTFGSLWYAITPPDYEYQGVKGTWRFIYDELYLHGAALYEVVDFIRHKEGWEGEPDVDRDQLIKRYRPTKHSTHVDTRIIDDKRGSRLISGEMGILDQLSTHHDIACVPAIKGVMAGIERCRHSLASNKLRIFSTCKNFINEIKFYRYNRDKTQVTQHESPQIPVKKNDHLMDCWRYIEMMEPSYVERRPPERMTDVQRMIQQYRERRQQSAGRQLHPVLGEY